MKSHVTPNQKRQLPGQSPEEGMGSSTPEARHQSPASSEDSSKTDLLHLGSGRGRREVLVLEGFQTAAGWRGVNVDLNGEDG
ncbi:hypothetical protein Tco_0914080 [Tanacetum coccineum]